MDRIFQIGAGMFIGIAAYFFWRGNNDGVFVAAVLGAVSFLLSMRFQVKERNRLREEREFEIQKRELAENPQFENDLTENSFENAHEKTETHSS